LTAALELSRLGIAVRIIDKQAAPPTTSRAVGVQARTLELLELRGLADEMVRLGNPGLAASFYGGGKRAFRLDFTRIDSHYHYLLFISQAETERILRTAVEKQGVRIERGVELVRLPQDVLSPDPNPVRVVLRHADGHLEQAQAPWLISAEGTHSTGHPRPSVRGQDTRRTVRPGRPAHRWRTRGDRSPHLLLRARLPGPVPHG
jgi:2-polyprenyl-6-methoxyphenol hydroxylase-like FAD-dependent oxidoreductase